MAAFQSTHIHAGTAIAAEGGSDEVRRLQGCLNDLISVVALPASWSGREPSRIIETLLECLLALQHLEFAYARLSDSIAGMPMESIRLGPLGPTAGGADEFHRSLGEWLAAHSDSLQEFIGSPPELPGLRVATVPLGFQSEIGVLVVGSTRSDFPTQIETLLLRVAMNQAVIGLQEARRLSGQMRSAEQLQARVLEGTAQLIAVSAELRREISARERTECERAMLASLVDNSTDFIGISALDGSVLFVNPAGQSMVGLDGDEQATATRNFDYLSEEDRPMLEEEILPALAHRGRWEGETQLRHFRTGALIPMDARVFMIKDPRGEHPVAMGTISRDISQRKRAESEALALKEELDADLGDMKRLHEFSTRLLAGGELQPVFEELLDATIAQQKADFGIVQIIDPRTQALEIVAQRNLEREFLDYFGGSHQYGAACTQAIEAGERVIIEDVEVDPGFAPHRKIAALSGFRAVQSTPLYSLAGSPLGVISTQFREPHRPSERALRLTDIYARRAALLIERQRTDEALRRSEFYLAAGERISHTGSWAFGVVTGGAFWSQETFRIFGYEPGAVEPSPDLFWKSIHPKDETLIRERFGRALREKADFDQQFRIVRSDRGVAHVHVVAHPAFDALGEVSEYVGSMIDVTERVRAEHALRTAREELAHVNRVMTMGELTASIAHEVNQPLGAIAASASACVLWLSAQPANLSEAASAAGQVVREAHRASEVIARIRSILKRAEPKHTVLDIAETIRDVVSLVQGEARAHGVSVLVSLGSQLPAVVGDRIQLQQVLLNLAMNAIDAMRSLPHGPRFLDIGAHMFGVGQVHIVVRDSGPGLGNNNRERIFDAFYTTKRHGLGMGLAISRSIIEAHGGRLWATPNDTGGETFQFTVVCAS